MSGGRGVRGNQEVSPLFVLRGGGGGRIATAPEATSKEGGSWGKHGFPHGSEPKARDAHARSIASTSSAVGSDGWAPKRDAASAPAAHARRSASSGSRSSRSETTRQAVKASPAAVPSTASTRGGRARAIPRPCSAKTAPPSPIRPAARRHSPTPP